MATDFGWQDLLEKVAEKSKLNVKLKHRCDKVRYRCNDVDDNVKIVVTNTHDGVVQVEYFDFCIFDMPDPLQIIKNPTYMQSITLNKYRNYHPEVTFIYEIETKNWPIDAGGQMILDAESEFISDETQGLCIFRNIAKVR